MTHQSVTTYYLEMTSPAALRPATARVLVNTCTLDSPAALKNYLARGFSVVREETQSRELAESLRGNG